jgi:hypothetical protein
MRLIHSLLRVCLLYRTVLGYERTNRHTSSDPKQSRIADRAQSNESSRAAMIKTGEAALCQPGHTVGWRAYLLYFDNTSRTPQSHHTAANC